MLTQPQHSVLSFDGTAFRLSRGQAGGLATPRERVIEEGLETILFYWANELLPAPRLLMLGRSNPLLPEQDLLAVDGLGRLHVFELKKDSATAESLHQLVSYLAQRLRDDNVFWLRRSAADALWYGRDRTAAYLAGLDSRTRVSTAGPDGSGPKVRGQERHDALLAELTRRAGRRSGLEVSSDVFRTAAEGSMLSHFGKIWAGPLADPAGAFGAVAAARLPPYWRLGLTRPGIVPWLIAPAIGGALKAAQPYLSRRLGVRCVSVDVRETLAGREWSVRVAAPAEQAEQWRLADAFVSLVGQVLDRHLEQCPDARDRVYVELPADLRPGETGIGWTAAGAAKVELKVLPDSVEVDLYYDWWTEGRSLKVKDAVHRISRKVRSRHPRYWPWLPQEPQASSNRQFVEGLAAMASDYWQSLKGIGALDLDEWAYFKPA